MAGRKWMLIAGLGLLVLMLVALAIFFILLENKPPIATVAVTEKGGLVNLAPEGSPIPPGPAEPTYPPASPTTLPTFPAATATKPSFPTTTAIPITTRSPETATPPTTSTLQSIIPWKIKIPAISIDTYVERVGVTKEGLMDIPKNIWNTAWFGNGGFKPGELGNAVIAGHLDAPGTKAVFWDLDKLKPQDKVYVINREGHQLTFEVRNSQAFALDNAPLTTVFGPAQTSNLNLITCNGAFDRASRSYNKRLVVFTKLTQG